MRVSLTASLFLTLALIHPGDLSFSVLPLDLEGSGYDLDSSGSGSGDWSEEVEIKSIKDRSNSQHVTILAVNQGGETEKTLHDSSVLPFDKTHWSAEDSRSGFVIVANSKSFLERKEVFASVIGGGVTGAMFAAALAAILIYKWQKKDDRGYVLGQQRDAEEYYHKSSSDQVVV